MKYRTNAIKLHIIDGTTQGRKYTSNVRNINAEATQERKLFQMFQIIRQMHLPRYTSRH